MTITSVNCRIFNPVTSHYSNDLSIISTCTFVILTEIHHLYANRAQREILSMSKGRKTCLLLEGIKPGLKVDCKQIKMFEGCADHIEARGSDIRMFATSAEENIQWRNLQWELALIRKELEGTDFLHTKEVALTRQPILFFLNFKDPMHISWRRWSMHPKNLH